MVLETCIELLGAEKVVHARLCVGVAIRLL